MKLIDKLTNMWGNLGFRVLTITSLVIFGLFASPKEALAVIQSLNGETGQTQTFQNDTNVTITPSNNVHSLGWLGQLSVSRGGTGAGSFTAGSLLFSNGTSISQNNSNLFWDDMNNRLGIGTATPTSALEVQNSRTGGPGIFFNITQTQPATSDNSDSTLNLLHTLSANSSTNELVSRVANLELTNNLTGGGIIQNARGVNLGFHSNSGTVTNEADFIYVENGTTEGQVDRTRGIVIDALYANDVVGISIDNQTLGTNNTNLLIGSYFLTPGNYSIYSASLYDSYFAGKIGIGTASPNAKLDVAGTIRGNSTMFLGSSTSPGCVVMGDSDSSGVTYVTVNDGVLAASTTKPSACQ